jgi:hypothetical protein
MANIITIPIFFPIDNQFEITKCFLFFLYFCKRKANATRRLPKLEIILFSGNSDIIDLYSGFCRQPLFIESQSGEFFQGDIGAFYV